VIGVPTHTQPAFAVVSGKALEYALVKHELEAQQWLRDQIEARDAELEELEVMVARATPGIRSR
jgi:hypothetical protein